MMTTAIKKKFQEYPVIAAVRTPEDFEIAFNSKIKIIFMVGGDVFKCQSEILDAKKRGIPVFFHMDLVEGIGKDASGMRFAKETFGITGVQSTRVHILKLAKKEKLVTVHRLFVTDFQGLESGIKLVQTSKPDFLELTPGILHPIVQKVKREQSYPIISSGLIATEDEVRKLLQEGASNIVCSSQKLWSM